jgi:hypothetical protein
MPDAMEQVQEVHVQINVQLVNIVQQEVQVVQIAHLINGQLKAHLHVSQNVVV